MSTFPYMSTFPSPAALAAGDAPPDVPLRIHRGTAEPEELAALTVILCAAQLIRARALVDHHRRQRPAGQDTRARGLRTPCWSGCWTCA